MPSTSARPGTAPTNRGLRTVGRGAGRLQHVAEPATRLDVRGPPPPSRRDVLTRALQDGPDRPSRGSAGAGRRGRRAAAATDGTGATPQAAAARVRVRGADGGPAAPVVPRAHARVLLRLRPARGLLPGPGGLRPGAAAQDHGAVDGAAVQLHLQEVAGEL